MQEEKWQEISYTQLNADSDNVLSVEGKVLSSSQWFSGHFPGEPILPGIALVSMVADVLRLYGEKRGQHIVILGIRRVRFRLPVKPGDLFSINLFQERDEDHNEYAFKIVANNKVVCTGLMGICSTPLEQRGGK